eukprot:TRINITY_DN6490_c0_g1_i1.p1 TRINITY_DN6490_c0_g1~~TRINITY_DN6490_c0_g1_i1.p1  ORF type:complete len:645 (+),score=157.01 TRINITY_DN6490_c0_g1_i1:113-1936(+)
MSETTPIDADAHEGESNGTDGGAKLTDSPATKRVMDLVDTEKFPVFRRRESVKYFTTEEEAELNKEMSDREGPSLFKPVDGFSTPLLTDMYQISMAYAYWRNDRHEEEAVFDLFFRKSPFKGEYTVFAGLEECVRFISDYKFTRVQIAYVKTLLPDADPAFFDWLEKVDCSAVTVYALKEGTVCFPRIPLLRVEGPVAVVQLLETSLLCLCNFATLICTNAARHRRAAGPEKQLLEFGLRRAQGPNGAVSASRYSVMGGFDATSNVLAGMLFGIVPKGTHAHSFVTSFSETTVLGNTIITPAGGGEPVDLWKAVLAARSEIGVDQWKHTNMGELIAFTAYALAYPKGFLALVDTYDTLCSGIVNFLAVAWALHKFGYKAVGIRLDSGDLAYLSREARAIFQRTAKFLDLPYFRDFTIVASNDLNEKTILSLNQQGHEIDSFGIGTHLVTCQAQPALGGVFKLVQLAGNPRIKLSEDPVKVTLPGRKSAYRLYDKEGKPIFDLLTKEGSAVPSGKILCKHPFVESKRAYVIPSRVEPLHHCVWRKGRVTYDLPTLDAIRTYIASQLDLMREDHLRPLNPTPYKVSVTDELYKLVHDLWLKESPIREYS